MIEFNRIKLSRITIFAKLFFEESKIELQCIYRYLPNHITKIKHFKLNFKRLHLKVMMKTPLSYLITFYRSLVHLKFTQT